MSAGDNQDQSQKTEEPSNRKLEEAKKQGQVFSSKEITTFISTLVFLIMAASLGQSFTGFFIRKLSYYLEMSYAMFSGEMQSGVLLWQLLSDFFLIIFIPTFTLMLANIASPLFQHGVVYSPEAIHPKLERISPIKGFGKLFSKKSLFELLKSIMKLTCVSYAIYFSLSDHLLKITVLYEFELPGIIHFLSSAAERMLTTFAIFMFFLGIADYLFQRMSYFQNMRMTKEEVKEEFKKHEGSPEIKSKLKTMRMRIARRRMMTTLPQADVIITNPTHYAVALQYDIHVMDAPKVIAKGMDEIALMIRKIAKENNIHIVEEPELAREIYATVKVGEFILVEHYERVARIIRHIMSLRTKLH